MTPRPQVATVDPPPIPAARMPASTPPAETPFPGFVPDAARPPARPSRLRRILKCAATALIIAAAAGAARVTWSVYVTGPWTRDGRVRVQVANVAPQVAGQITEVRVVDNQFVHKGDVLYVIEAFDFRVALAAATAQVKQRAADLQVKRQQAERRLRLSDLSTTAEEQQVYAGQATTAQAAFDAAQQLQAQAEINLARTLVRSPVNGFVSNLLLRVGDYAHTGVTNVYVIDTDSYWIDGYFEETKLARLCVGDPVEAWLIGYDAPIIGVVDTVTRGISVADATPSTQGLPAVNAVYTWVRLAQRVPVRVRITGVPPDTPLIAGLTATIIDRAGQPEPGGTTIRRTATKLASALRDAFGTPSRGTACIPPTTGGSGASATIPEAALPPPARSGDIFPGLAPGLRARPTGP